MEIQEIIVFNGVKYKLMGSRKYYLSQSNTNEGRKNPKGLHVAIWEYYNKKEVPKGYHVHHKDGNTFNNDISNLECISAREHLSKESKKNWEKPGYREKAIENLKKASEKAKEWHRSEEGRRWHKEHAKKTILSLPKYKHICEECGKEYYSARRTNTMFCCSKCQQRNYDRTKRKRVKKSLQSNH